MFQRMKRYAQMTVVLATGGEDSNVISLIMWSWSVGGYVKPWSVALARRHMSVKQKTQP